jgi:predicted metal-binding membrane protein
MATVWAVRPSRRRARVELRDWLRTVGRPGPERWLWSVALAAWVALVWQGVSFMTVGSAPAAVHQHHAATATAVGGVWSAATIAEHLLMWAVMVAATMLPLVAWNLRVVGQKSPRERRRRATIETAAGWASVWLAAGAVVVPGLMLAGEAVPRVVTVTGLCAAAVAWQSSRVKRVAVARCHRSFAPPLVPSASGACLRFGQSLGRDCLVACWPGMVLMSVAGHHLLTVVPLAWLSWRDRRRPHDRPATASSVAVLLGVGALVLTVLA